MQHHLSMDRESSQQRSAPFVILAGICAMAVLNRILSGFAESLESASPPTNDPHSNVALVVSAAVAAVFVMRSFFKFLDGFDQKVSNPVIVNVVHLQRPSADQACTNPTDAPPAASTRPASPSPPSPSLSSSASVHSDTMPFSPSLSLNSSGSHPSTPTCLSIDVPESQQRAPTQSTEVATAQSPTSDEFYLPLHVVAAAHSADPTPRNRFPLIQPITLDEQPPVNVSSEAVLNLANTEPVNRQHDSGASSDLSDSTSDAESEEDLTHVSPRVREAKPSVEVHVEPADAPAPAPSPSPSRSRGLVPPISLNQLPPRPLDSESSDLDNADIADSKLTAPRQFERAAEREQRQLIRQRNRRNAKMHSSPSKTRSERSDTETTFTTHTNSSTTKVSPRSSLANAGPVSAAASFLAAQAHESPALSASLTAAAIKDEIAELHNEWREITDQPLLISFDATTDADRDATLAQMARDRLIAQRNAQHSQLEIRLLTARVQEMELLRDAALGHVREMIQQLPFPYDHRGQITRLNTAHFTALEAARRRLEAETTIKSKAIAATRRQLRQAESECLRLRQTVTDLQAERDKWQTATRRAEEADHLRREAQRASHRLAEGLRDCKQNLDVSNSERDLLRQELRDLALLLSSDRLAFSSPTSVTQATQPLLPATYVHDVINSLSAGDAEVVPTTGIVARQIHRVSNASPVPSAPTSPAAVSLPIAAEQATVSPPSPTHVSVLSARLARLQHARRAQVRILQSRARAEAQQSAEEPDSHHQSDVDADGDSGDDGLEPNEVGALHVSPATADRLATRRSANSMNKHLQRLASARHRDRVRATSIPSQRWLSPTFSSHNTPLPSPTNVPTSSSPIAPPVVSPRRVHVAAPIAAAAAQLAAAALQKLQMATSPAPVSPAPVSPAPVSTTPAAAPAVPEPEVSADADVVNEHELKLSALIDRISSLQQRLSTSAEKTKRSSEATFEEVAVIE